MHIVIEITDYFEWVPLPPGVKPTKQDFEALRAKVMHDESVRMRVTQKAGEGQHFTCGLPESELIDQLLHSERKGSSKSRAQIAATYLQDIVMPHHVQAKSFKKIDVQDEGASEELFDLAAKRYVVDGVLTSEQVIDLRTRYVSDKSDIAAFLVQYFNVTAPVTSTVKK